MDPYVGSIISDIAMERACDGARDACQRLLSILDDERLCTSDRYVMIGQAMDQIAHTMGRCTRTIQALEDGMVSAQ